MADTGSKTYIAKDSSAEEILSVINNFTTNGVEIASSYGYGDFSEVIEGSVYGSTRIEDIVITGKGWVFVDFYDSNGAECFDALMIDGVVCYIYVQKGATRPVFLPFNESVTFKNMYAASYHSLHYKVYLYG